MVIVWIVEHVLVLIDMIACWMYLFVAIFLICFLVHYLIFFFVILLYIIYVKTILLNAPLLLHNCLSTLNIDYIILKYRCQYVV